MPVSPILGETRVLVVKDGELPAGCARVALERAGLGEQVHVLADGREAAWLLFAESAPVLPLRLIVMSDAGDPPGAIELLERIRADPVYGAVKVVILGETPDAETEQACLNQGNASYVVLPQNVGQYRELLVSLVRGYAKPQPRAVRSE